MGEVSRVRIPSSNHVGAVSLIVAASGFCALEVAHGLGGATGLGWTLARFGFEAAVIGGVADWFAVRALFYPVPGRPLPALPHTNLVLANRDKLTDGLVDLVENQLLSPSTVKEQMKAFSASVLILEHLESASGRASATDAFLSLVARFADDFDDPTLREFITEILREQVREADLAVVVGYWLMQRVEGGDTSALWMAVAGALAEEASTGAFDEFVEEAVAAAVAAVKEESWLKGQAARLFIAPKKDALRVRNAIGKILIQQSLLPAHPLNEKLDAAVRGFALKLIANDRDATQRIQTLQAAVADHANFDAIVGQLIGDLQRAVKAQTASSSRPLRDNVSDLVARSIERLKRDRDAQTKLDDWVRRALSDLAARYHSVIGDTARKSIDRLPGDQLVAQLETKVGQDLQFIRLNGAVVGGLVGVLIGAVRTVLG